MLKGMRFGWHALADIYRLTCQRVQPLQTLSILHYQLFSSVKPSGVGWQKWSACGMRTYSAEIPEVLQFQIFHTFDIKLAYRFCTF